MFKCKECGCEYEEKPDYCDCGNDTFDEIKTPKKEIPPTPQTKNQEMVFSPKPAQQKQLKKTQKTFSEQYPEFERMKNFFDPISTVVFVICIITAIAVIFFIGNPEETPTKTAETSTTEVQQVQIPSIESFWDNSTAGIINNEKSKPQKTAQTTPAQTQTVNPILALTQPKQEQQQTTTPQPVQQKPATQPVQQKVTAASKLQQSLGLGNNKNTTTVSNSQTTQKPAAQTTPVAKIPQTTKNIATQPKTSSTVKTSSTPQTTTQKSQTTATTKPAQTTVQAQTKPNSQTTTANIPTASTLRPKATIDTAALKKELDNYKVSLRNTIGRKVDFTRVIGDGECIVAFKIDSSGKLTNRSFSKQSSNITLNDAVYKAVMSTPSYNPPPSAYKNETLNLKIRFYNGNYDISLY